MPALPNDPDIRSVFEGFPDPVRPRLLTLRQIIVETAAETPGVGRLVETLKWGQPAYLTEAPKSGSPIRLGTLKPQPFDATLFVHCATDLIERFRAQYGDALTYEGKRAVRIPAESVVPEEELRHCIAMALTYHLRPKV